MWSHPDVSGVWSLLFFIVSLLDFLFFYFSPLALPRYFGQVCVQRTNHQTTRWSPTSSSTTCSVRPCAHVRPRSTREHLRWIWRCLARRELLFAGNHGVLERPHMIPRDNPAYRKATNLENHTNDFYVASKKHSSGTLLFRVFSTLWTGQKLRKKNVFKGARNV